MQRGTTIQSETDAPTAIETNRISQFIQPPHSRTFPVGSAGTEGQSPTYAKAFPNSGRKDLSEDSTAGTSERTEVEKDTGVQGEPIGGLKNRRSGFWNTSYKNKKNGDDLQHTGTSDLKKDNKPKQKFTFGGQLKATLFNSWINVLLIMAPVGIIVNYLHIQPVAIFVINFIAIIPLAAMLSYATEEIAIRTGETLGGLLNATFGSVLIHRPCTTSLIMP